MYEQTLRNSLYNTHSCVSISGLSALEVVYCEEVSELGLDAAQRLGIPMKQQHYVHHGEALAYQRQQVTKEPCRDGNHFMRISIQIFGKNVNEKLQLEFILFFWQNGFESKQQLSG